MRIVDFHLHLPWWLDNAREASSHLLGEMDRSGVDVGVLISIEASIGRFKKLVDESSLARALGKSLDLLAQGPALASSLWSLDVQTLINRHLEVLERVSGDLGAVLEASRLSEGRLLPVAAYNPDVDPRDFAKYIESLGSVVGVKVYPTLYFDRPDSRRMVRLYKELEARRGESLVIVHTGCDPGIWELPEYCRFARPSLVARAARALKGTSFVLAHMGAYSALNPGIYFGEALEACSRDNIYLDTSAVDPLLVEKAVSECGDDRILYGSDYPYVSGHSMGDSLSALKSLSLEARTLSKILGRNALSLLSRVARHRSLSTGASDRRG
ncbi:MAG: amidohydrolase family protein [Desulfurococcales archaeon]|nr:amidohydrolase family protein [Desulfurococcales archaeon]